MSHKASYLFSALILTLLIFLSAGSRGEAQNLESFNQAVAIGNGELSAPTSQSFTLPLFDPALGTLTGVTMTYAYAQKIPFLVTNNDSNLGDPAENFTNGQDEVFVGISGPDHTNNTLGSGVGGYGDSVAAGSTVRYGDNSVVHTSITANVPTSNLSIYEGTNTAGNFAVFTEFFSAEGLGAGFRNGQDLSYSARTTVTGTATVTYAYGPTATPEPGTVALLMSGSIVGIGFLKRRRSRR